MPRKPAKSTPVVAGRAVVERKSGASLRRTTVYFGMELDKRLRHFLVDDGRDLSEVVATAVTEYLDKHEK